MITYIKIDQTTWTKHQDAIMALEAMAFSAAQCHPVSFYQNIVDNPRHISYLAIQVEQGQNEQEKAEQVVGFSFAAPLELFAHYPGVKEDPHYNKGTVLYGADMVVNPNCRKQGIGKGFKAQQLEDAKALGYQYIAGRNRLEYAHAMWCVNQSLGAVEVQRLKGIYKDGREPNECIYYHIDLNALPEQYAVFGNPIGHSRSPFIHTHYAKQTGQKLQYKAIEAPIDDFAGATNKFFEKGGKGANVTVPFKEQAFAICTQVSDRAQKAGAVNTLIKTENGEIHGDNTDGQGLVADLLNNSVVLKDANILLAGAGGASRGVILPILAQNPKQLVIANRTLEKAQKLATEFAKPNFIASTFEDLAKQSFDVIINATSASLTGNLPAIPRDCLTEQTICYDMVYSSETTAFNKWAEEQGVAKTIDGLGMLVEQAAESFRLWRDVMPQTKAVLESLREKL